MITNKNHAKTMTKHTSCDCKCYTLSPSTCICEKSKCLKSIADTSVIACDEIIDVIDIVSTNMTHTIATSIV